MIVASPLDLRVVLDQLRDVAGLDGELCLGDQTFSDEFVGFLLELLCGRRLRVEHGVPFVGSLLNTMIFPRKRKPMFWLSPFTTR